MNQQQKQFRVGGIYRQADGRLVRLGAVNPDDPTFHDPESCRVILARFCGGDASQVAYAIPVSGGLDHDGWRRLTNGEYIMYEGASCRLVPGEVDENGNALTPFRIGGCYKDAAGRVYQVMDRGPAGGPAPADGTAWVKYMHASGAQDPAGFRNLTTGEDPSNFDWNGSPRHLLPGEVDENGNAIERKHPPLTWNQSTPFDPFADFEVSSGRALGPDCFAQGHALQRVTNHDRAVLKV